MVGIEHLLIFQKPPVLLFLMVSFSISLIVAKYAFAKQLKKASLLLSVLLLKHYLMAYNLPFPVFHLAGNYDSFGGFSGSYNVKVSR